MKEENKKKAKKQKLFSLPDHQVIYLKKISEEKGIAESEVIRRVLDKEIENAK